MRNDPLLLGFAALAASSTVWITSTVTTFMTTVTITNPTSTLPEPSTSPEPPYLPAYIAVSGIPGIDKAYIIANGSSPLTYSPIDNPQGSLFDISDGILSANGLFSGQDRDSPMGKIYMASRADVGPGRLFPAVVAGVRTDQALILTNDETEGIYVQKCNANPNVYLGTYMDSRNCVPVDLSFEN